MKKFLSVLFAFAIVTQLFAFNAKKTSVENMYTDVGKVRKHKVDDYEKTIINATYLYYKTLCGNDWDKETWKTAVNKSADLCENKAAITAAKTGAAGEKIIQALIVTTGDALDAAGKWVDKKSKEYDKKH